MFKKLVSNLPFQPTLLSDIAFYSHRLKQEQIIRRFGFLLIIAGFLLQIITITFPPQASLATNASDIVYGASSRTDVLTAYRKDEDQLGRKDIKNIFDHYGIGESQIENAKKVTVSDDGTNYINTSRSTTKWADTFVPIKGAVDGGIYEFPLSYWRKDQYPNGYPALTGISTYGFRFWILLKGCGNIVFEKGAKKPNLEITKELSSGTTITSGGEVSYSIKFRNTGAVNAKDTVITDSLPAGLAYKSHTSTIDLKFSRSGQTLTWKVPGDSGALSSGTRWHQISLVTEAAVASPQALCNQATVDASNAPKASAQANNCVTVIERTCPGTGLPIPAGGLEACSIQCADGSIIPYTASCPIPQVACSSIDIIEGTGWNSRIFKTTLVKQPGASVQSVDYIVNGSNVGSSTDVANAYAYSHTFADSGPYSVESKINVTSGALQQNQNCVVTVTITAPDSPDPILVTDKAVRNDTQAIMDANNTTANPSDKLTYTLTIKNTGAGAANNVELTGEYAEDVRDILEYADIVELNDGVLNQETGKISWGAVTIAPGETISKQFIVQVKNPLPATPISISNPLSFDFSMHNKYGRTVTVNLQKPASKTIEQTVTTLPNTGPGSSTVMVSLLAMLIGYFYFRNRLLTKELLIIQKEFQGGGM